MMYQIKYTYANQEENILIEPILLIASYKANNDEKEIQRANLSNYYSKDINIVTGQYFLEQICTL